MSKANNYWIFDSMNQWLADEEKGETFPKADKEEMAKRIAEKFTDSDTAYGLASKRDFGEFAPAFANLFAHNNKQYYIYKAISDSTKIGYLSRRQYYTLCLKIKCWNTCCSSSGRESRVLEFLSERGTMASPYKLLKRSFKENPRSKFLARFFPLKEDKKTTENEKVLIDLCDTLMRSKTNITIEAADINDCYAVQLADDYSASGNRFATSSCMYNFPVGKFYEAFGAEGRIVYERGKPIGRFLLWNLPDGKQYVDRLYVQAHGYEDALAEIDKQFPNAIKYPFLRDNCRTHRYLLPIKNKELLLKDIPRTPYLDTFCSLVRIAGQYFLSNGDDGNTGVYVETLHNVSTGKHFCSCPHCQQMYWMGDSAMDASKKEHLLMCTSYKPRQKKLQEMLAIYRNYMKGGNNVGRTALFEV